MIRKAKSYFSRLLKNEKGLTLVECLITVALVGTAVTAFAVALSTGSLAVAQNDKQTTAQIFARAQLEYTKGCTYNATATTYPTVNATDGYSIAVSVTAVPDTDNNIQKVTANISRGDQVLLSVSEYKVNR